LYDAPNASVIQICLLELFGTMRRAIPTSTLQIAMPEYEFRCDRGHRFKREMTREEFVDTRLSCECGAAARRAPIPIPGGIAKVERDVHYPYYNWQIPLRPGQKPGEPNVMSKGHEADICAGSIDGARWEKIAVGVSDYASTTK
jgi:hypothetical protein